MPGAPRLRRLNKVLRRRRQSFSEGVGRCVGRLPAQTIAQLHLKSNNILNAMRNLGMNGAPRSMKMGTIRSPLRYDVAAHITPRLKTVLAPG
jgi:hypothetical protein